MSITIIILFALCYLLGNKLLPVIKAKYNGGLAFEQFSIAQVRQVQDAGKIPVLTYHHLLKEEENAFFQNNQSVISEQQFAEQMKFLNDNGYKTISAATLNEFLLNKKSLPAKSIVLTFDDGYQSNFIYAYPILKQYGFKAMVFVIGSMIQDTTKEFNPHKLTFLGWDEINQSKDVFDFQSHSYSLHYLDNDNKSHLVTKPKIQIEKDLLHIKELLTADYFAYPYGQYDLQTIEILKAIGYKMAFTNHPSYVTLTTDLYKIPRFSISPRISLEEFKQIVTDEK